MYYNNIYINCFRAEFNFFQINWNIQKYDLNKTYNKAKLNKSEKEETNDNKPPAPKQTTNDPRPKETPRGQKRSRQSPCPIHLQSLHIKVEKPEHPDEVTQIPKRKERLVQIYPQINAFEGAVN